ncbi:glycosyl transferase family 90 [Pontibacter sp. G13]|uniref:glycosyl transferase family 90 n=1 Tax=Pontibacter sp. G13 TaxID=3074898 RepID=UPI00288A5AA9|nr:glycosyl transferase family 90 [Pontibacter sp. G13]WNJ20521.1 glycosyl transferase family 90 [Pontibacter sp. G13]
MKFLYYLRNVGLSFMPQSYFRWRYRRLKAQLAQYHPQAIQDRVDYYVKPNTEFDVSSKAVAVKNYERTGGSAYYFDLKEFLYYFEQNTRFAFHFGDETHIESSPTLFKARPIAGDNANSVLFKLNKHRHFRFVDDKLSFREKRDQLVWRGGAYQPHRKRFIEAYWEHPMCNAGQTNKPVEDVPWQKEFMSISEQLQYKFILCIEGNDVATNLKWAMSSNSLVIMPKPKFETWFMEGKLEAGVHYAQIRDDYSDLEETLQYYIDHPAEAESIIAGANAYVQQFQDEDLENLLCLMVLEKYAALSGQKAGILAK